MRKILLTLFLASAAASPALAQRMHSPFSGDRDSARPERSDERGPRATPADNQADRTDRQERRFERQDRAEPTAAPNRPNWMNRANGNAAGNDPSVGNEAAAARRAQIVEQMRRSEGGWPRPGAAQPNNENDAAAARRAQMIEQMRHRQDALRGPGASRPTVENPDLARERFGDRVGQPRGNQLEIQRAQRNDLYDRIRAERRNSPPPFVSTTPRPGAQPPVRDGNHRTVPWSRNWRDDHRYDWQRHRHDHRSRFSLGFYYDPFGWGYQPYSVGWRMWPSYYSRSYWLNDPWQYRLPYAPPGTRWVRYFNDAVLVDLWSGQVVDVVYDFFW